MQQQLYCTMQILRWPISNCLGIDHPSAIVREALTIPTTAMALIVAMKHQSAHNAIDVSARAIATNATVKLLCCHQEKQGQQGCAMQQPM
jgi:hypothetical protein